jgi:hypothetical protein
MFGLRSRDGNMFRWLRPENPCLAAHEVHCGNCAERTQAGASGGSHIGEPSLGEPSPGPAALKACRPNEPEAAARRIRRAAGQTNPTACRDRNRTRPDKAVVPAPRARLWRKAANSGCCLQTHSPRACRAPPRCVTPMERMAISEAGPRISLRSIRATSYELRT